MITRTDQTAFFESLFTDDNAGHLELAREVTERGGREELISQLLWPALGMIDLLRRDDAVSDFNGRCAIRRIGSLARRGSTRRDRYFRGRLTALVMCGEAAEDEVCADVAANMLESLGAVARMCGGGVPAPQIINELRNRPVDLLVIASIGPSEAPATRQLMDQVRELPISIRPRIVAGGGLFARAEGLALEMGADLELTDPIRLLEVFNLDSDCSMHALRRQRPHAA